MPKGMGYSKGKKAKKMVVGMEYSSGRPTRGFVDIDMGPMSARDVESVMKERMVRKGIPNHVSA